MQLKKIFLRIFYIIVFLLSFLSQAQELPPVTNYEPGEYEAGNQNWMISQSKDDHIYLANSAGLLEFTGTNWNLYPVPNNTIVRAVEVVGDKIFTGAYMEVGYWEEDEFGILEYTSLIPEFPQKVRDGEQFWRIIHIGEIVFIQSFEGIYMYNLKDESLKVLPAPSGALISNIFKSQDEIFFLTDGKGLFTIKEAAAQVVIPSEDLKNAEVIHVLKLTDGGEIVTRKGNFFFWDGTQLIPKHEKLTEKLEGASLFSAMRLKDNSLLLGTVENGLYHVNEKGEIIEHFNQENGLQNNTVLSLFLDEEENVWAGLDNGLSVLNLDSSFRLFKDNVGRIGTVYTSLLKDGYLYLGTNQGLYYREEGESEFKFVKGTNGQVWSLQEVDALLFMGHNNGTYIIEGKEAERISDRQGTWTVKKLNDREDLYIQGHYNGISLLKKKGDSIVDLPMLKEFPHSSKNIISETDGDIWIGNEHKGVFKMKLHPDLHSVSEIVNYPFTGEVGISSGIFQFDNHVYFSTRSKIFQFNEEQEVFEEDSQLAGLLRDVERTTGKVVEQGKKVWFFTNNAVVNVEKLQFSEEYAINKIYVPGEMRTVPTGYENISGLGPQKHLLGLVDGYLLFDGTAYNEIEDYEVHIDRISQAALDGDSLPVSLFSGAQIGYNRNNIGLTFSISEYKKFLIPQYSYRLKGLSTRWSEWSTDSEANYKNLASGDYIFEVRGKVGDEILAPKLYEFTILRPWYFSNIAIAGYVFLLILVLIGIHKAYKKVHRKRFLEHEKNLRMKNMEAEQKIIRLQNEQLEKEMEGKNKELAASTMSLVKKNEFLTNLKEELREAENSKVSGVIKIIDKEIGEEDNWKMFKEAFNNADKDFFDKIRSKHPELTSNDLRLCAYLRLNLSSKEIAPLINISIKSVEIKRYRLRKKMNLSREVNLTDYIMEI